MSERPKPLFRTTIELADDGKTVKVNFSSGGGYEISVPERLKERNYRPEVVTALTVSRLALNEAFQDERTGVDQVSFTTRKELGIRELPHSAEASSDEALRWAGSTLQRKGWKTKRVADLLIADVETIEPGIQLGRISKDQLEIKRRTLERTLNKYRPGPGSAMEKSRKKRGRSIW